MATEQNRRDADETGTFLDDTASLKDTGFLDDTDVLSSDTFEEESFLDDDVPEEGAAAEDHVASADDHVAPEGAREFEGGEDDYAEDPAAYAYMTQPRAGLTENAPAKEQNTLPEGPEEKEEGRRRGSLLNLAIGLTAVAIAGVSVYLGIQISGTRRIAAAAASYASIGQSLEGISVIGGDKFEQVAKARQQKDEQKALEAQQQKEREELLSKAGTIPVSFTLSTIQSDIKVKIRRDDNGSLITGVPFKISVADEAGKKTEYEDDDQDGIIYKTGIKNGKYTVTLEQLLDTEKVIADTDPLPEDFKLYSKFKIPEEPQTIAVTDKIAYKKVDVADEVKSESQVNVAKEDTARNDTVVESKIQDTVEWVESTKTEITDADGTGVVTAEDGYQEVQKKDVPDPSLKAFTGKISGNFRRLSKELPAAGTSEAAGTGSAGAAGTADNNTQSTVSGSESGSAGSGTSGSNGNTAAGSSDNGEGMSSAGTSGSEGSASAGSSEGGSTGSGTSGSSESSGAGSTAGSSEGSTAGTQTGQTGSTEASSAASTKDTSGDGKDKPKKDYKLTIPSEITIAAGDKTEITAAVNEPYATQFAWSRPDASIAQISSEKGKRITVTGIKSGTAEIVVTASLADPDADPKTLTGTIKVTVTEKKTKASVQLSPSSITLAAGRTQQLSVTVRGEDGKTSNDAGLVRFQSADEKIASVSESGVITAKEKGTTTVTAELRADANVRADVQVKVTEGAVLPLKDKDGNQLYVKDGDSYREATTADYSKYDVFYRKGKVAKRYRYTGWQTLDGLTYFFDKTGKPVTGTQIIQGVSYTFNAEGVLNGSDSRLGIDVSTWNGQIDWSQVARSGVSYAIIRAGYRGSSTGALIRDSAFSRNASGATAAGIRVGIYIFSQATNEAEAVEEASMAVQLASGYHVSLPIFIDVEGSGGRGDRVSVAQRTANIAAFCRTVENSGYKAGVYANKSWFTHNINVGALTGYHIWLAQYAAKPTYTASRYDIWQYSSSGRISGIKGNVDMNMFYRAY
ncbi:MAG: GH25 family lysozyme [Lachnospiraceae bacterium]|nr:GH25 family lysozyme [Lachnospiraceae bacterium]